MKALRVIISPVLVFMIISPVVLPRVFLPLIIGHHQPTTPIPTPLRPIVVRLEESAQLMWGKAPEVGRR